MVALQPLPLNTVLGVAQDCRNQNVINGMKPYGAWALIHRGKAFQMSFFQTNGTDNKSNLLVVKQKLDSRSSFAGARLLTMKSTRTENASVLI